MKRTKVLHIISSLNTGGAELFLLNLLDKFENKDIDHDVLCLSGRGTLSNKFKLVTNNIIHLDFKKNLFHIIKNFYFFYKYSKQNKYNIIQGWMYHGNLFALMFHFFSNSKKLIWNIRQTLYSLKNEKFLTRITIFLNALLSNFPKKIICNSELSIKQHKAFGFKKKNFIFIPNGIDLNKFNFKFRKKDRDKINIAHIARFHPMKNHALALKVSHEIIKKNDKVKFFFMGKNVNFKNSFFKKNIDHKLINKKIFLLGEKKNINIFLRDIDILISTSLWGEGFPNVILEASAMGIPCVSTNIGDAKKILINGYLINNTNDYKLFTNIINKIIGNDIKNSDVKYNKTIAHINKKFSIKNICYEYEKIYCN